MGIAGFFAFGWGVATESLDLESCRRCRSSWQNPGIPCLLKPLVSTLHTSQLRREGWTYMVTTAMRSHSSTFRPRSTIRVPKSSRCQTRSSPSLKSTQRNREVSLPGVEPSPRMKIPEVRSYMPLGWCRTSRRLKLVYSQFFHLFSASVKTLNWSVRKAVDPEG